MSSPCKPEPISPTFFQEEKVQTVSKRALTHPLQEEAGKISIAHIPEIGFDPTPHYTLKEREEEVCALYELIDLLLQSELNQFFSHYRKLSPSIQQLLQYEFRQTGASLERLSIPLPIHEYTIAFRPIIQAAARLADKIASEGIFKPYLTDEDIAMMAQDLAFLRSEEMDPIDKSCQKSKEAIFPLWLA